MRKTKIICTIGPASQSEEVLTKMCLEGMNVARMNFSHDDHAEQKKKMDLVKKVREKLGIPLAIMLDTKGPEYRISTFGKKKVDVNDGNLFTFTTRQVKGDETIVSVSYGQLIANLNVGDIILVNNGLVSFKVEQLRGNDAICRVVNGGTLSDRKSMSFPNKVMPGPYLSEQDRADILFGIENDVDFVAASFISSKEDVIELRKFLDENGGRQIEIIAKIENRAGVDNIEEICQVCDGIMIARGDLGVEIPFVEVPAVQKKLISKCRLLGKRVITATEMMESMITNPRPTRAEISDVANAVYDGSSAIMLSGESAAGKFPVEAVRCMAQIAEYTENHTSYRKRFLKTDFKIKSILDAISHATCAMAIDVEARAIVVCSTSGITARMVSRFRSPVDIVGATTNRKVWHKLSLSWGVTPVLVETFHSMDVMFHYATTAAQNCINLEKGDKVVLTGGPINGKTGNTNTIKVETI